MMEDLSILGTVPSVMMCDYSVDSREESDAILVAFYSHVSHRVDMFSMQ